MNDMLEGFMAYLETNGLVRFDMRNGDNDYYVASTSRLHQYAFLAKRFGLDMDYEFDTYFSGPASTSMMGDYNRYSECHAENPDGRMATAQIVIRLPDSFQSEEFLSLVRGRDNGWLEIATTLMDRNATFSNRKDLIENVEWTTNGFSTGYIAGVLDDLIDARMVELK